MSLLPASQFFSALFFIMLVTLGLDSQFAMVDVLIAGFLDEFPSFRYGWKRTIVLTSVCLIGFLLGIPILTNGGYWFFNLINDYSAYHGLLMLSSSLSSNTSYTTLKQPNSDLFRTSKKWLEAFLSSPRDIFIPCGISSRLSCYCML